ncbi:Cytochrome b-c1 complex subunit 10 [Merluccius polli]|uniref:Cytochrome b-c1 complex subunit 10 n=1 Tax=Merluccius polli TaxID=89951 RepID=A0AA47M4K4_MERPO|nr:Cytochrome b-c1 complex subunit 10 [Merluccius polli]
MPATLASIAVDPGSDTTLCFVLCRVPNLVGWGTVAGVGLVHFTDWRLILDYVPYINGKFKEE